MAGSESEGPSYSAAHLVFEDISLHAHGVVYEVAQARLRPVRHNLEIERLALWHTVQLAGACRAAVDPAIQPEMPSLREATVGLPSVARYDILSVTPVFPSLIPVQGGDLDRLMVAGHTESFEPWGEAVAEREPSLVAHWHEWLWDQRTANPDQSDDFGEATVMVTAALRLGDAIRILVQAHH
jgi:hypothetical protein